MRRAEVLRSTAPPKRLGLLSAAHQLVIMLCSAALALSVAAEPARADGRSGAALGLAMKALGQYVSPKRDFGAAGDCATADDAKFALAAASAVSKGLPLRTDDACYALNGPFNPPAGLVWRSDYSTAHKLLWLNPSSNTDGLIGITAAADIDGLVIDANRSGSAVRSNSAVSIQGVPFYVRGTLTTDAPSRRAGVKIGRVWVMHGQQRAAMAFVNTDQLAVTGELRVSDNWGAAVLWGGGNTNARVAKLSTYDIGALQAEGSRFGQVLSYFVEPDPLKAVASWYSLADRYTPSRNILPQANNVFAAIVGDGNTDTGIYSHDFIGVAGIGNGGLYIGSLTLNHVGKDAIKQREAANDLVVQSATLRNVGNRFVVHENLSSNLTIENLDADGAGVDALGLFFNGVAGGYAYTGGGNNGAGQTLTTSPGGIVCDQYAPRLRVLSGSIRNIHASPADGSQGHGEYIQDCDQAFLRVNIDTADSQGYRLSNATNFSVEGVVRNGARTTSTSYFGYLHNDASGLGTQTGTITTSTSSRTVTGSGTAFSTALAAGQYLYSGSTLIGQVAALTSSTQLTLVGNAAAAVSGAAYSNTWRAGVLTSSTGSPTVTGTGTSFLTDIVPGQSIYNNASRICRVKSVASNTSLTCGSDTDVTATASALVAVTSGVYSVAESVRGQLRLKGEETSGAPVASKFQRMDGFPQDISVQISALAKDYSDSANAAGTIVISQVDSGGLNISHAPIASARVSFSGTTNSAGQFRVAHGLYTKPALPIVRTALTDNRLTVAAIDASFVTFQLLPPAGATSNYVPNPSFSGAVTGTPGTLPTGVTLSAAFPNSQVVGTGVEGGNDYFDLRLWGTPASTTGAFINIAGATAINAALGESWTFSGGVRQVAGATTGLNGLGVQISETDFSGVSLTASTTDFLATPTDTGARSVTRSITKDGASHIQPLIRLGLQSGQAFDITLRIGGTGGEITAAKTTSTTSRAISGDMDVEVRNSSGY